MKTVACCCLFLLLTTIAAPACFGPKLYCGVGRGAAEELRFALLSLYIKEKTGVEMNRVEVREQDAAVEIAAERLDLAFTAATEQDGVVLRLPEQRVLLAGKRLRDDLQFTTVLPALAKLQRVLEPADWPTLVNRVKDGAGAVAVARAYFKSQGAL